MAKITANLIVERHEKFPESTEKLIEAYAYDEYKKAISDLFTIAQAVHVENTDTTVIVISDSNYKMWKDCTNSHWEINKCTNLEYR